MLTIVALVAFISAAGCGSVTGGGSGPGPVTQSDAVALNASVVFGTSAPRCTASITWTFEPLQLTGRDGSSSTVTDTQDYDVQAGINECTFNHGSLGLRAGKWRISASGFGSCDAALAASITYVKLGGASSCTVFP
ncbi:hypothetical protein [Cellulomonas dongxiuzhuiae]|uniref:hypothetical protein n=1 Tax=Cellulomonas dongxiuzhuiae TaxID=2819979 RepID=UPI001AAF7109|nr:hypothetical protein [Cellulomonas dongxiuzhuiae]MBO3087117.1 hypothetical protein [Cellulomonas dongxiuzhuiae]